MSDFAIYALTVDNGILGICQMPGLNGDCADDLALMADWKPSLVISMTEQDELTEHGLPFLRKDIAGTGARCYPFPVADFGTGTARQERDWKPISTAALAALKGGGRVLVHCRAGCGRSGMAALRLMIEAGEDPAAALTRLRGVRACAVETEEQRVWAETGGTEG